MRIYIVIQDDEDRSEWDMYTRQWKTVAVAVGTRLYGGGLSLTTSINETVKAITLDADGGVYCFLGFWRPTCEDDDVELLRDMIRGKGFTKLEPSCGEWLMASQMINEQDLEARDGKN